eukprot:scaffold136092_cov28-Tisochrysis_lutea.AAC.1
MTSDASLCFNVRPAHGEKIRVANNKLIHVTGVGSAQVNLGNNRSMLLTDVLIAPELSNNLFSARYGDEHDNIKTVLNTPDGKDEYRIILPNGDHASSFL